MEYENKSICAKCGGMCCKKSGCDYYVSDFKEINKSSLLEILEKGNVSIVAALDFYKANGKDICSPYLYLRARNTGREVVDLFSFKTRCSMLREDGCTYDLEHRPGGGVNLIPYENENCRPLNNPVDELMKWKPYQSLLSKLVKRLTGKTADQVLKENVEETFYKIFNKDFDGALKAEVYDLLSGLDDLVRCFPEEYESAKKRYNSSNVLRLKKFNK